MPNIFFGSDFHFYHLNIIKLAGRPFDSVEEMNEALISGWNSVVRPNDTIYCLGDFAFRAPDKESVTAIFNRLNGKKHLIFGNHEHDAMHLPWDTAQQYLELKDNGERIVLFHYPIQDWNGKWHGSIHLHGHIHSTPIDSKYELIPNRLDVGVDNIGVVPISLEEVVERLKG